MLAFFEETIISVSPTYGNALMVYLYGEAGRVISKKTKSFPEYTPGVAFPLGQIEYSTKKMKTIVIWHVQTQKP